MRGVVLVAVSHRFNDSAVAVVQSDGDVVVNVVADTACQANRSHHRRALCNYILTFAA